MRNDLSVVSATPRPVAAALARATALALLALLTISCHSDNTTAPAIPKSLEFTAQPVNTDAVTALGPIRVSALDGSGHVLTSYQGPVTVGLATNPGNATLGGTKTVNAANGVAVFTTLKVNRPGTGYTLTVSSSGVSATSGPFNIVPGPVATLVFSVQPPGTVTAGSPIAPPIQVQALDAAGNLVTQFNGNVTMTIGTNPTGGLLSGTPTEVASGGVATFPSLSINKAGTGYRLTATAAAGSGQSNAFNVIAGIATQLVFTTQPLATTAAGSNISPAVVVTAQDQFGNNATTFANAITIAITSGTGKAGAALSGTKTVTAVNGAATFSTLSIDSVGTGYTLSATAAALVGGFASATFNIVPGVATQLVFTGQPSSATAGANIAPAIVVTARDAKGNTATGFTGTVKVAISTTTGTAGAKLSGADTVTATAAGGLATFGTLSVDKSGTGYTLSATATSLSSATSGAFAIVAGVATQLVFTVPPVNTAAGVAVSPAIKVAAQDALGNTDLTYATSIGLTIGTNGGGGTLSGGGPVTPASGVATFAASLDKVGSYTITASSGALPSVTSASFSIFANTATHLVFNVQPSNAVAGVSLAPAVAVQALDGSNNVATGFTGGITLAITAGSGDPAGTLTGSVSVNAVAGVATFSTLSIQKAGDNYKLDATAGGLPVVASGTFNITPAAATHLVFAQQPTSATAGIAIAPAVTVAALDAFDNRDTAYIQNVDVTIGSNPGGGTLSGATTAPAAKGIATFSNLRIDKSSLQSYTLHATSGSLTDVVSGTFTINGPTKLAISAQPTSGTASVPLSPAFTVLLQDAQGTTVPVATDSVRMEIANNGGTPAGTLSGTLAVAAVNGVATFSNLLIDKSGPAYTVRATSGTLTSVTSLPFNIVAAAATKLAFSVEPTTTTAGAVINSSGGVKVAAQDGQGNTDTTFTGNVTVAITGNTGKAGASLSGGSSVTVAASKGVATFSALTIDSAGAGYTLTATGGSLAAGTSNTFNIAPGTATTLVFGVQPSDAVAGIAIAPTVMVIAKDGLGNVDTSFKSTVTLTAPVNPGGATVSNQAVSAVAGVATFTNLSLDKAGTGYRLEASGGLLTSAQSNPFNITFNAATQLVFLPNGQPTQVTVGANIAPAVKVAAQDAFGNTVTSFANNVAITLEVKPHGTGSLGGTTTKAAISGVATFSTLDVSDTATGFKLGAAAVGVTSAVSNAFNVISNNAAQLFFNVQPPATTTAGNVMTSFSVEARDSSGQLASGYSGSVTIALNIGSFKAGTFTQPASGGIATFNDIEIDSASTAYKLTATGTLGVGSTTSRFFTVAPGAADHLAFRVQPSNVTALSTISPQVEVTVVDQFGNVVTGAGYTGNVAMSLTTGPGTLTGNLTKSVSAGVATFGDLSINTAATGDKLTATASPALATSSTKLSSAFDVTPSTASHLVFASQPTTTTAGQLIPTFKVEARDASNNLLTGFSGAGNDVTITITSGTGTSGATLSGTTTVTASNGAATFSGLSINKKNLNGYTLSVTAPGLAGTTSNSFTITAGAPALVSFQNQPANTNAGQTMSPVTVILEDSLGNTVTGVADTVGLSFFANPGAGTLSGTPSQPVDVSTGIATFNDLSIDAAGTGYRLLARSGTLISEVSQAFRIAAGTATQLLFTVSANDAVAGVNISPAVKVTAFDSLGNVDTLFAGTVTVTLTSGTGTPGAVLSANAPQTATPVKGVASFSTLSVDKAGTGYTLTATATGLTGTTSGTFSIAPAAATKLGFVAQPTDAAANATIAPPVQIAAQDQFGNTVTTFSGSVTMAIGTNAGGAGTVLSGAGSPVSFVNGVASFANLSINNPGTGYTLSATSSPVLTAAASGTFNIQ